MGKKLTQKEAELKINENFYQNIVLMSTYVDRRSKVTLRCKNCNHIWETEAKNVLYLTKGVKKHCCLNCGDPNMLRKNGKHLKCAYCDKKIYKSQYKIKNNKSGKFYCSVLCGNRDKNKTIEKSEWSNCDTYRKRAFINYEHKCAICGWDENNKILEVHHKDGNRENNELENLIILCPICHKKISMGECVLVKTETKYILETLEKKHKKKRKIKYSKNDCICPNCGDIKNVKSKICIRCYSNSRRKNIPTKEELLQDVLMIPFTHIGKKYKVSDNAVRKWCKQYNIPSTVKELKTFK